MLSKAAGLWLLALAILPAQQMPLDPQSSVRINLPDDSPVSLLKADLGESRATARGSAMVIDLQMVLSLRNAHPSRIRGVTLLVLAQEVTPGGKASVTVPSLDVASGAVFPVRIDLRLLRPAQIMGGPLVQVNLDGVLFQDLSFYGPNRLDSRRTLTAWELEARRDRAHFKSVLAAAGPAGLQREILARMAQEQERPRLNVRVVRGPSVTSAALGPEREAQFAFLKFPDSPVQPIEGSARIVGSEAREPRIQVRNRSAKPVRYVEIGWIVKDRRGSEFMAASLPASEPRLQLAPGRTGHILQDTALQFSRNGGEPVEIAGMTGFVSQVEFADGGIWIPNWDLLAEAQLLRILAPSPEEQRLTDIYRKKGVQAVVLELAKY